MAGWLVCWLADRRNAGKFQFFLISLYVDQILKPLLHLQHYQSNINAFKLEFSAKAWFKVVDRSVKIGEAIVFLVDPYY